MQSRFLGWWPMPPDLIDLDRVRRARAALRDLARKHPELIDPGATSPDNLAGWETTLADLEEPVAKKEWAEPVWLSVRIPGDLVARAASLVPALAEVRELRAGGPVTKAAVVRLALMRGLADLEAEQGKGRKGSGK